MVLLWEKSAIRFEKQALHDCFVDGLEGKELCPIQRLKRDFVSFVWLVFELFLDDCPLTSIGNI